LLLLLAIEADKLKVVFFSGLLRNTEALAMLPHIAFLAGNAVAPIIL
jgi:hypothetical protein